MTVVGEVILWLDFVFAAEVLRRNPGSAFTVMRN